MADSTGKPQGKKFPLFHHKAAGRWAKKIAYKTVYFLHVTSDPDGSLSLALYHQQKDDLKAGRRLSLDGNQSSAYPLKHLANKWLTHKKELVKSGELAQRSFDDYKLSIDLMIEVIGPNRTAADLGPEDFLKLRKKMAQRFNAQSLFKRIGHVRSLFKHAYDDGLLEEELRYGRSFDKPRAKVLRQNRLAKGRQDFTADEIKLILSHAKPNLKAMILLGVQAGFGNTDCAELEESVIDLQGGWLDWARSKTAVMRRVPLWPETVDALREAIAKRPKASPLVFIGPRGEDYVKGRKGYRVAAEFKRACGKAGITGRGFYCLRRSFQTQADSARDAPAVSHIMGHLVSENDMPGRYRQSVPDERLRAVVNVVRAWLFGGAQ